MDKAIRKNDEIVYGMSATGMPQKAMVLHVVSQIEVVAVYNQGEYGRPKAVKDNFTKNSDGDWKFKSEKVTGFSMPSLDQAVKDFF